MTTRNLGGKGNRGRRSQKTSCRATTSRRPPTRYERSHTRKVNLCIIQVVRKHIGHEPIAARHAGQVQRFHTADFNPYLNYHRPCGFATIELSDNGKRRRRYRLNDYRTPYEKLLSLNDWESCLKEGVSAARLEQQALRMSDTECALRMQQRKRKLLDACRVRR